MPGSAAGSSLTAHDEARADRADTGDEAFDEPPVGVPEHDALGSHLDEVGANICMPRIQQRLPLFSEFSGQIRMFIDLLLPRQPFFSGLLVLPARIGQGSTLSHG